MLKKYSLIAVVGILVLMAASPARELVGSRKTKKTARENNPRGMVYIKRGTFMMGNNDQPLLGSISDKSINVSVDAFWMDEAEITNNQYRQFVDWVRDSLAMRALIRSNAAGYEKLTTYKDREYPLDELTPEELEKIPLNWKAKIPWKSKNEDDSIDSALSFLFYDDLNNFNKQRQSNPTKLYYRYTWIDFDQAALRKNRYNVERGSFPPGASVKIDSSYIDASGTLTHVTFERPLVSRNDLYSSKIVAIYPDTMVWMRDLQYSFNEPRMRLYFSHHNYDNYPVVGVTWEQATAFCYWRTALRATGSKEQFEEYRLPTSIEWEYAARGGRKMGMYPWGGPYTRDSKGCFLANFKPMRGSYGYDTGTTTVKVRSYEPNDYGLYDMAGNVAEWTATPYMQTMNSTIMDMNPDYRYNARADDPDILKRKIVKGGSWKDIAYFLQCGINTFEYQFESRNYIGFRCVRSYYAAE
jgi:Uncharacterized conserved protein